jgi:hypothetical protein
LDVVGAQEDLIMDPIDIPNEEVQLVVESYKHKCLSRREALTRMLGLGFSASGAYVALGLMTPIDVRAEPLTLSKNELQDMAVRLTAVVADPEIVKIVETVSKASTRSARESAARNVVTTVLRLAHDKYQLTDANPRACLRVFETEESGLDHVYAKADAYQQEVVYTSSASDEPVNARLARKLGNQIPTNAVQARGGTICGSIGYIACVSYGIQK